MIKKFTDKYLLYILGFVVLVPFIIAANSVFSGSMPFWFDPARDFLSALGNQSKVTLIGQPTGIPGLFYGPYWIWLLSAALYISKDPRIVQFLVLTLPYFVLFPIILYKLRKTFGFVNIIALWILFIFGFMRYTIFPWNPHLAPLLVLIVFYFLIARNKNNLNRFLMFTAVAGFFSGLIGNFHISFALGLIFGIGIFFFINFLLKPSIKRFREFMVESFVFASGLIVAFIPFIAFEARHGFNQIRVITETLSSPYAVVGIKGLTQNEIANRFFQVGHELLTIPTILAVILVGIPLFVFIQRVTAKKTTLEGNENSTFILCVSTIAAILLVYLTSKNPVWEYHFVAVEVILLLLIGFLMKRFIPFRILVILLAYTVMVGNTLHFLIDKKPSVFAYDTLAKKEYIVREIDKDAIGKKYTVYSYNPGIYSYEYSYLFKWLANKDVPYDPSEIKKEGDIVYLIIQKTDKGVYQDYINAHAHDDLYQTTKRWDIEDGTVILKRESLKKE